MKKITVILDNGHGLDTPGKRSPLWSDNSQLFEYQFNRDIVRRIESILKVNKIETVILVPEIYDIPLSVRVQRVNEIFKKNKNCVLLSIHGNMGEKPNQGTGWEVWTSPGQTEGDKIADFIYKSAKEILSSFKMRLDYSDKDPDKESEFYILVHTSCPAVLTENLFYDNEKDCKFMLTTEGRSDIARLNADGIMNYLKSLK